MARSRITDRFLRSVKEPGKYYDRDGLFVQVYPSGAKCWQQRISIGGRRRTLGLGGYPVVTLKEAREQALENLRLVRSGGDPLARKRPDGIPTFGEAAVIVLENYRPTWTDPTRPRVWMSSLERFVRLAEDR